MVTHIVHRAVRMARRFIGRVVYVIRDAIGKLHFTLSMRIHGRLLLACAAGRDGVISIVRHV